MKLGTFARIATLVVAPVGVLAARGATVAPATGTGNGVTGMGNGVQGQVPAEIQALRADIEAMRAAREKQDKAGVMAAFTKLKTDWQALPPALKVRVVKNHPVIATFIADIKTLQGDLQIMEAAHLKQDKAAVEAAVAKLRTDWATVPPVLRLAIEENHPALARLLHGQAMPQTKPAAAKA
jgi:hypothetical protein